MKYITVEDAQILIPNKEHKNFTDTGKIIEAETIVEGNPVEIQGLRKGEPFTYRMFKTQNGQLIFIKKVKPMEHVEVKLGADSSKSGAPSPTIVKLPTTSLVSKNKVIGAIAGALAGYGYCKYKKHDGKKTFVYASVGAVAGYLVGLYLDHKAVGTIKPSK